MKSWGALFPKAYFKNSKVRFCSVCCFFNRSSNTFLFRCYSLCESAILYLSYSSRSLYTRFINDCNWACCYCKTLTSSLLTLLYKVVLYIRLLSSRSMSSPNFLSSSALSSSRTLNINFSWARILMSSRESVYLTWWLPTNSALLYSASFMCFSLSRWTL